MNELAKKKEKLFWRNMHPTLAEEIIDFYEISIKFKNKDAFRLTIKIIDNVDYICINYLLSWQEVKKSNILQLYK